MKTAIKCRRDYILWANDGFGGENTERVRITRRADGLPDGWFIARFDYDDRPQWKNKVSHMAVHESHLRPVS